MIIAQRTNKGLVRLKNEDAIHADKTLMIVADGMGGHHGGEVASRVAVESVVRDLAQIPQDGQLMGEIDRAIQYANHAISQEAEKDERLSGMGTTITLCLFMPPVAVIGHVGDSRAYLFRNGRLTRLTRDHSLVEELVRGGYITPEEAVSHPHRHVVTRALGSQGRVRVDVKRIGVEPGDRVLLCSDGLTLHMRDCEIQAALRLNDNPEQNASLLENQALERGGEDNISILIALMEEGDIE